MRSASAQTAADDLARIGQIEGQAARAVLVPHYHGELHRSRERRLRKFAHAGGSRLERSGVWIRRGTVLSSAMRCSKCRPTCAGKARASGSRGYMGTWRRIVAVAMAFVQNNTSFYVLRFLLRIAEAGFFPGVVYYFTQWPCRRRNAARPSPFFWAARRSRPCCPVVRSPAICCRSLVSA